MRAIVLFAALVAFAMPQPARAAQTERIVLSGGCFWGMQAVFEELTGVQKVTAGYSGGAAATAHYEMVSTGMTGHAESVDITYDPAVLPLRRLLDVYFTVAHDPTELNYQGPDEGTQYRSEIWYTTAQQRAVALAVIADLQARHVYHGSIVTKVEPLRAFYAAEDYHQEYLRHHPDEGYIVQEDMPKLAALHAKFPGLVKSQYAKRG